MNPFWRQSGFTIDSRSSVGGLSYSAAMNHSSTTETIAAWRRITTDPNAISFDPVAIEGTDVSREDTSIRILVTREHAVEYFASQLFDGLDVLIMSASSWTISTHSRVTADHAVMLAYIDRLISTEAAMATFDFSHISAGDTIYRLLLLDADQNPVKPSPLQASALHLRRPLEQATKVGL